MTASLYPVADFEYKHDNALSMEEYKVLYQSSINHPNEFWGEQGLRLDWMKPYTKVKNTSFKKDNVSVKWFEDGTLNVSSNCIDRHLPTRAKDTAIIWEGDSPGVDKRVSYQELHDEVCKLANGLKKLGVKKGDRVIIYMPMVPQAAYAMLACARIGAVHSVVFAGFSPNAIADRIIDCGASVVITADVNKRGGKPLPLKENVEEALEREDVNCIQHTVVFNNGAPINPLANTQVWWHDLVSNCAMTCEPEEMNAEDPLFVLYTSGSTGKPKGLVHTSGGYLVWASMTHEKIFNYKPGEVYWCAADVGWITGHTYIVYGPLANGATTVMFEGVPTYPDERRIGQIIDKHQISILYTAPTAIRALMCKGDLAAQDSTRDSLRLLGTVGEPINPEAWQWYYEKVGEKKCQIVDTWWQTETGGAMITPLAGTTDLKPGSATLPFFGVQPALVDSDGNELEGEAEGNLIIKDSWPGQARSIHGDHERYGQTYFSAYDNVYFTGDGCKRDADGYYWITGRVDDVLNVSGHRLGTAEIESSLVAHEKVAEAAVVGYPHDIKGQGIYVYLTPISGTEITPELTKSVRDWVRHDLSPIATPDMIQWSPGLPKTRSGKIMRRILRKVAANEHDQLGDISTLADPSVVDNIIENRLNK
ncbi:acetate--CoA ligase [Psychrosphaera haliotis]|uniref:Acetyl-coenzyme A synthetase n=1 Tax=Psychrosphaera haliotis TaxID=555083 RepID=A0A6N8F9A0_9GAMM|nr:acetate--CoA ligase [Psychrosphaera haliotis]MUH72734.1 acetate--CoA ligase [Psychrosphaera haliotis]